MNEIQFEKLKEASWRRNLTAQEEATLNSYFAAHSEARTQWEDEAGLNELIGRLPDAPVSTNFTTRILQEIQGQTGRNSRPERAVFHWLKFNWVPRIAVTILLVCGGLFSFQQYQRTQVARAVATVSSFATVPQQWLQDFDAISSLSQPPFDNELLAALQ